MSNLFDSFDASNLGVFKQSPLGERGGITLEFISSTWIENAETNTMRAATDSPHPYPPEENNPFFDTISVSRVGDQLDSSGNIRSHRAYIQLSAGNVPASAIAAKMVFKVVNVSPGGTRVANGDWILKSSTSVRVKNSKTTWDAVESDPEHLRFNMPGAGEYEVDLDFSLINNSTGNEFWLVEEFELNDVSPGVPNYNIWDLAALVSSSQFLRFDWYKEQGT